MSPKRSDEHDNEVDLPSLGDLNEDDELYLRYVLALAEHGAMGFFGSQREFVCRVQSGRPA